jgi:hypothetical protein
MTHEAWFYLAGALAQLVWKFCKYVFIGMHRMKRSFKDSATEWFELVTIDAKVSWLVTGSFVWVIGAIFVKQIGIDWLLGGVLSGIPVMDCTAFMVGAFTEYAAPAAAKWMWSKLPFSKVPDTE